MKIYEISSFISKVQKKLIKKDLKFKVNIYSPRCNRSTPTDLYSLELKFDILFPMNDVWNTTLSGYIDIYFTAPRLIKISINDTVYKSNLLPTQRLAEVLVDGLVYIVENNINIINEDDTVSTRQ